MQVAKRTRQALIQSLGGPDHVSPQQRIAVQQIAEAEALRQSLFADAANGNSVAVADFVGLASAGQRGLKLIGMARRTKTVPNLRDYLAQVAEATETAQAQRSTATPADDTECAP